MSRLLRAAIVALFPLALGACAAPAGCSAKGGAPDAGAAEEPLTPVPAPEGLVAELCMTTPQATWTKLRSAVAGPAMFLPQGFGALVTTLVGLPITLAGEIDDAVPAVGAAIKRGADSPRGVLGVHVKAGDRLVDQLTKGEAARFVARPDPASRITMLADKDPSSPAVRPVALGVIGNYLLVGKTAEDLAAVGPYVARTLAVRPPPRDEIAIEIPEAALSGPLLAEARRLREQGEGIVAPVVPIGGVMNTLVDVFSDARHARVGVNIDASTIRARLLATPKPGDGPAAKALADLAVGDARPLLDLPASSSLGLLWRERADARAAGAPSQADALGWLLGKDTAAADKSAIAAALKATGEARGEWTAFGLVLAGTGPTALARAPVVDEEKMRKAMKQLVDLGDLASVKAALKRHDLDLSAGKAVVENLGDAQRVRFKRTDDDRKKDDHGKTEKKDDKAKQAPKDDKGKKAAPADPTTPRAIDLLYVVDKNGLFAAAGYDPKDTLRALVRAPEGNPRLAAALGDLGDTASFVLFADALRLAVALRGGPTPPEMPPLVLAIGRAKGSPDELWGRVDLPAAMLQVIGRELMRR